jgi:hypothetical protein
MEEIKIISFVSNIDTLKNRFDINRYEFSANDCGKTYKIDKEEFKGISNRYLKKENIMKVNLDVSGTYGNIRCLVGDEDEAVKLLVDAVKDRALRIKEESIIKFELSQKEPTINKLKLQ